MFGDIMEMMGKIKEAQKKVEATKKRLGTVLVNVNSSDGLLKITLTANRTFKNIEVAPQLLENKEMLEDYLVVNLNRAIQKATKINEAELAATAKENMPNIPGMDGLFNK
ncbi:MAG: YbaB/EbfC family nucleoid-associated protein [Marinirhabdus sp.]